METAKASVEYQVIKNWYGDRVATRSKVPLINHIDEGLIILNNIGAEELSYRAFCLHPLVQLDKDLDSVVNNYTLESTPISASALMLAMEYRVIANSALSDKWNTMDKVNFGPLKYYTRDMLIADKVQNYKDFLLYHSRTHDRAHELGIYFLKWFKELNLAMASVDHLISKISKDAV